ncbi:MAG: glyoxalase/bleomycin resistance/dioxygenase family protein [Nanoarchaeota archaeon]|nr:glyoxalase/bleomycin resistance/dioxygenase family protein [Nanoarchaeota archaeon]
MTNDASTAELSYLVLYSPDIEATRAFYESLGLVFRKEKHGQGAEHYASKLGNVVFELYPGKLNQPVRLGLKVLNLEKILDNVESNVLLTLLTKTKSGYRTTVVDPHNIKIDLIED